MGFIYQKAKQHGCEPPEPPACEVSPGDIWQCDDCGMMHVRQDDRDGQFWAEMPNGSDLWARTVNRLKDMGVDTKPLFIAR